MKKKVSNENVSELSDNFILENKTIGRIIATIIAFGTIISVFIVPPDILVKITPQKIIDNKILIICILLVLIIAFIISATTSYIIIHFSRTRHMETCSESSKCISELGKY
jgi:hypothetical protein